VTLTVADIAASARQDGQVAPSKRSPRAGQPKRRTFTAASKLEILQQYEQLEEPRERGALLRREGLYHSHIEYWREARDKGALRALSDKPAMQPARGEARRKMRSCRRRTKGSPQNWPGRKQRWRSWEKHTRRVP